MFENLRRENGSAALLAILRVIFGVQILNAGMKHLVDGQAVFATIVGGSGTAIGSWVVANVGLMFPLVVFGMILTGLSLLFGVFARLGSFGMFLFSVFFILGMNSWMGNIVMLGASIAFIIVGPGRYLGLDSYLLRRVSALKIFA
nr:TQO small subunit DoxD [Candidatus Njordarchaeota archaeon]